MSTEKLKNRWLIALSAVGIHISIGSVYAYSVITNPVKDIFLSKRYLDIKEKIHIFPAKKET